MDEAKRKRLEKAGWKVGDAGEFLELSPDEVAFIEMKLALATHFRAVRQQNSWTQQNVARRLGSSQSRVAKMEAGDPSVSVDLLIRSLLRLGASPDELGRVIAQAA